MYKLLVADDEFNIRDGIANAIPWEKIDIEVVGTAVDGTDALEKTAQLHPDIIITDVNMDKMDGLELSEILRQTYPNIKVIILSGYDEFEYVRRALELRVYSYVMKPVRSKELLQIVGELIGEIEEEQKLHQKINSMEQEMERNKSVLLERFLFDLLQGNMENEIEFHARRDFLDIQFGCSHYTCLSISIPEHHEITRNLGAKKLQSLTLSIREIAANSMNEYEVRALAGEHGTVTLIAGSHSSSQAVFLQDLTEKLERMVEDVSRMLGLMVVAAVGRIYETPQELSKSYREAELALEHIALVDKAGIIHIGDIPSSGGCHCIYPVEIEKRLLRSLIDIDEAMASSITAELFDRMESQSYAKSRMRIDILSLIGIFSRKAMDMGVDMYQLYSPTLLDPYAALERYHTRGQMENWFKNIVTKTIQEVGSQQIFNIKSVIAKANKYLEDNYANPGVSLITIAEHLHLSPSYFSRLYKKETGETYVEVLTKIRLNMAKTLLKETNEKISAISESVGYPDSKYFCTLFKKYEDITPVEFRESA